MAQADIDDPTLVAILRLAPVAGVGTRTRLALLERFGTASAIFSAAQSDVRAVPGVGVKLSLAIARATVDIDVEVELEICRENDIRLLLDSEEEFPRGLRKIYDPPGVLYVRSEILPRDALLIAVVGTRHATRYGLRQAERLGAGLARAGLTIVSGLARGIDAAAHRGALRAEGRTLAVLGGGTHPEHRQLAEDVADHGALISEHSWPRTQDGQRPEQDAQNHPAASQAGSPRDLALRDQRKCRKGVRYLLGKIPSQIGPSGIIVGRDRVNRSKSRSLF